MGLSWVTICLHLPVVCVVVLMWSTIVFTEIETKKMMKSRVLYTSAMVHLPDEFVVVVVDSDCDKTLRLTEAGAGPAAETNEKWTVY